MDAYYNSLYRQLQTSGYRPAKFQEELFFSKEQEDRILLLRIIPERLPGQDAVDIAEEHDLLAQAQKNLMIMTGKKAESLLLLLERENPGRDLATQIEAYDDVWFFNRDSGRLFIYENQKADFYGLSGWLESFALAMEQAQKRETRNRLAYTFTPVNTAIILINLFVFIVLSVLGDTEDSNFMAFHGGMVYDFVMEQKEYYLLLTSMFIHFGIHHILENMLMLLMVGRILERYVGKVRYLIIYMAAGLISSVASLMFTLSAEPYTVSGGASGAICGVLGGLFFIILENVLLKHRRSVEGVSLSGIIFIILISVGYGFTVADVDNAAHLGGLIAGFVITALLEMISPA